MGNKTSYHIFLVNSGEMSDVKLRHIFPSSREQCDDKDVALATFILTQIHKKPMLLVEFAKDKKTKEISYSIIKRNFVFKAPDEKEPKLDAYLKNMCQTHASKIF